MILAIGLALSVVRAADAESGVWRAHFTGILCRAAPCPDWELVEPDSGERFIAVVLRAGRGLVLGLSTEVVEGRADLLIEGSREQRPRPGGPGSMYWTVDVIRVLSIQPLVPPAR